MTTATVEPAGTITVVTGEVAGVEVVVELAHPAAAAMTARAKVIDLAAFMAVLRWELGA